LKQTGGKNKTKKELYDDIKLKLSSS
jgi:hypothetical protein